jgi:hypothetical protein
MLARVVCLSFIGLLVVAVVFGCKDKGVTEPEGSDTTMWPPHVRKPNIYLYPETTQRISIQLVFALGGNVIQSDPDYGTGWLVNVEPSGRIDGHYDYLFYEAEVPDRYQYSSGWIVHRDTLSAFFVHTMTRAGFKIREITDFIDYWGPRLTSDSLYDVYPQQEAQLNDLIRLQVSPAPQSQLRLFFVIRPAGFNQVKLAIPDFSEVERIGYHLAEWGVILK